MDEKPMTERKISRRDLLKGLGAMGLMAAAAPLANLVGCAPTPTPATSGGASATPIPDCILTPESTEGPFYIASSQMRQDITEGKPGAEVQLVIQVVNAKTCEVIPSAMVDVWHADAEGLYSAFPRQGDSRNVNTTGQNFLRGIQVTDSTGTATFKTVYPGWYPGRTAHVHFKVHFNNNTQITSQFAFPDQTSTEVYADGVYQARGDQDTPNASDLLFSRGNVTDSMLIKVVKQGDVYIAKHIIGVELQ